MEDWGKCTDLSRHLVASSSYELGQIELLELSRACSSDLQNSHPHPPNKSPHSKLHEGRKGAPLRDSDPTTSPGNAISRRAQRSSRDTAVAACLRGYGILLVARRKQRSVRHRALARLADRPRAAAEETCKFFYTILESEKNPCTTIAISADDDPRRRALLPSRLPVPHPARRPPSPVPCLPHPTISSSSSASSTTPSLARFLPSRLPVPHPARRPPSPAPWLPHPSSASWLSGWPRRPFAPPPPARRESPPSDPAPDPRTTHLETERTSSDMMSLYVPIHVQMNLILYHDVVLQKQ